MSTSSGQGRPPDFIDQILDQWARERPDLDVSPMGVIGRISRAAHILEGHLERVFAELGVQGGRFDVLAALRRAGPPHCLSPTALYNSLLISSGAMTNRLDRLTADGLVERIPDSRDGRSVLVKLTAAGLAKIDEAVAVHLENEQKLLTVLSPEDRELLTSILNKLLIELGDHPHASDTVTKV